LTGRPMEWLRRRLPGQQDATPGVARTGNGRDAPSEAGGEGLLPQFLGIGVQKGATSWLWVNLKEHPEIWMPPFKELHFFDYRFVPESRKWALGHIHQNAQRALRWHVQGANKPIDFEYVGYLAAAASRDVFSEAWYRRLFNRPAAGSRMRGDITPEYCQIGAEGIAEVKSLLGAPKLIYTIRDPVSRALSQIRMNLHRRGLGNGSKPVDWAAIIGEPAIDQRGDYARYVPQWRDAFGERDLLFLPFGDVAKRPEGVMQEVERFLGIAPFARYSQLRAKVHETEPIPLPDEVVAQVRQRMAPQVEFLRSFFGPDFLDRT
jgi:Sulfotransferase family